MTMGFLVSFGGVVLVFVLLLVVEQLVVRRERRLGQTTRPLAIEAAASLDRVELAVKQVEIELARARELLRAS